MRSADTQLVRLFTLLLLVSDASSGSTEEVPSSSAEPNDDSTTTSQVGRVVEFELKEEDYGIIKAHIVAARDAAVADGTTHQLRYLSVSLPDEWVALDFTAGTLSDTYGHSDVPFRVVSSGKAYPAAEADLAGFPVHDTPQPRAVIAAEADLAAQDASDLGHCKAAYKALSVEHVALQQIHAATLLKLQQSEADRAALHRLVTDSRAVRQSSSDYTEALSSNDIAVRRSRIKGAGRGAFARRSFMSGQVVGQYLCTVVLRTCLHTSLYACLHTLPG